MLKKFIKKFKEEYLVNQVEKIDFTKFGESDVVRKNIIFFGNVQGVGFRMEVYLIATKLGLTGWVMNKADGSVEAEIQGEENKINFLKKIMCSLKRSNVTDINEKDILIIVEDKEFSIKY